MCDHTAAVEEVSVLSLEYTQTNHSTLCKEQAPRLMLERWNKYPSSTASVTRVAVAYPCPALSATKRTSHALISSIKPNPRFAKVTSCRKRKTILPRSMVVEAVSCEDGVRASIRPRPKPRVPLKSAPGILPVRRSRFALVGRNLAEVRNQLSVQKTSGSSHTVHGTSKQVVL